MTCDRFLKANNGIVKDQSHYIHAWARKAKAKGMVTDEQLLEYEADVGIPGGAWTEKIQDNDKHSHYLIQSWQTALVREHGDRAL